MNNNLINRQCNDNNRSLRDVCLMKKVSTKEYLPTLINKDMVITGGSLYQRNSVVLEYIKQKNKFSNEIIVILGENDSLSHELVSLATNNAIGQLFVINSTYKNYDVFYKMDISVIVEYFCNAGTLIGIGNTHELSTYATAFIALLSRIDKVSLSNIRKFANNSDSNLANKARDLGLENIYHSLIGSPHGGQSFRNVLNSICTAFSNINYHNTNTNFSITSAINNNLIVYIDTFTHNSEIFSSYFIKEISGLLNKNITFILSECTLTYDNNFIKLINRLNQRHNIDVLLSTPNVVALSRSEALNDFAGKIIFLGGNMSNTDAQSLLSTLGEYEHFKPTTSVGTPPHLFATFLKTVTHNISSNMQPKILIEELNGSEVILTGHNSSQIIIANTLF